MGLVGRISGRIRDSVTNVGGATTGFPHMVVKRWLHAKYPDVVTTDATTPRMQGDKKVLHKMVLVDLAEEEGKPGSCTYYSRVPTDSNVGEPVSRLDPEGESAMLFGAVLTPANLPGW